MTLRARSQGSGSSRAPARALLLAFAVATLGLPRPARGDLGTDAERLALAWSAFGQGSPAQTALSRARRRAAAALSGRARQGRRERLRDGRGARHDEHAISRRSRRAARHARRARHARGQPRRLARAHALRRSEGVARERSSSKCARRAACSRCSRSRRRSRRLRSPQSSRTAIRARWRRPAAPDPGPRSRRWPRASKPSSSAPPGAEPSSSRTRTSPHRPPAPASSSFRSAPVATNSSFSPESERAANGAPPISTSRFRVSTAAGCSRPTRAKATTRARSFASASLLPSSCASPALPRVRSVTLLRARWDLAEGLPERWPPEARAPMSAVLREQALGLAGAKLVDEALGVQGPTAMPVAVEPGACYLAVVIELRGTAQSLALAARAGGREAQSRAPLDAPGTALSFCAGLCVPRAHRGRSARLESRLDVRALADGTHPSRRDGTMIHPLARPRLPRPRRARLRAAWRHRDACARALRQGRRTSRDAILAARQTIRGRRRGARRRSGRRRRPDLEPARGARSRLRRRHRARHALGGRRRSLRLRRGRRGPRVGRGFGQAARPARLSAPSASASFCRRASPQDTASSHSGRSASP